MIIQTAPADQPHFVITQIDHATLSGKFAAVFGNDLFAPLTPKLEMVFVAEHHDDGWGETDQAVMMDESTGLPFHLTQTPLSELVKTSSRSPQINEISYSYSGLLSSMHTYGLFNGRYGLSDKIFIDLIPAEHKPAVEAMLDHELVRQERLKHQLKSEPLTASWVEEATLFANYKLLQFFDTLALYFHMVHPSLRGESVFQNVPRAVGDDVAITICPVEANVYALDPFPFSESGLTFSYQGRWLTPQSNGTDLKRLMEQTTPVLETFVLVDGAK